MARLLGDHDICGSIMDFPDSQKPTIREDEGRELQMENERIIHHACDA